MLARVFCTVRSAFSRSRVARCSPRCGAAGPRTHAVSSRIVRPRTERRSTASTSGGGGKVPELVAWETEGTRERRYRAAAGGAGRLQAQEMALGGRGSAGWGPRARDALQRFFFPAGYPHSVSADYWAYQRWWALAAAASSANSVLATSALLAAVGVSTSAASALPLSAAITWVLKDGLGSVGMMLFAGRFAAQFDADPKAAKWRAELLASAGVALELATPAFPMWFLPLASLANVLKGIAGMASGATRAYFNRNFALRDNLGEVTAKAAGQGIAAYLLGMGVGIAISTLWIQDSTAAQLVAFAGLTAVNLLGSYRSLLHLTLPTLNAQRLHLLIYDYLAHVPVTLGTPPQPAADAARYEVLTPEQVRERERFVRGAGVWRDARLVPGSRLGAAFESATEARAALTAFERKRYVLGARAGRLHLLLKHDATQRDALEAVFHAHVLLHLAGPGRLPTESLVLQSATALGPHFAGFFSQLLDKGWREGDLLHFVDGPRLHVPPPV